MSERTKRELYPDLLRGVGVIAVIVLHIAAYGWGETLPHTGQWQIFNFYDSAARFCVPVFVMLSGMFGLDPERDLPDSKAFGRQIFRFLFSLLFWGVVYMQVSGAVSGTRVGLIDMLKRFLTGNPHYHLWFVYMLIGLYLVSPILRIFVAGASRQELAYFLLLSGAFVCLPSILSLFPALLPLRQGLAQLHISVVGGYAGYYVLGYYIKAYPFGEKTRKVIYRLGVIGLAVTVLGTSAISVFAGAGQDTLYGYYAPNVMVMALALSTAFLQGGQTKLRTGKRYRFLQQVGQNSFGIFLIHDLFNILFRAVVSEAALNWCLHWPVIAVPLQAALVLGLSFGATLLLRRIPGLGRLIT